MAAKRRNGSVGAPFAAIQHDSGEWQGGIGRNAAQAPVPLFLSLNNIERLALADSWLICAGTASMLAVRWLFAGCYAGCYLAVISNSPFDTSI